MMKRNGMYINSQLCIYSNKNSKDENHKDLINLPDILCHFDNLHKSTGNLNQNSKNVTSSTNSVLSRFVTNLLHLI